MVMENGTTESVYTVKLVDVMAAAKRTVKRSDITVDEACH